MKEHDEVKQNRGDNIVDRHALNSSHLGNDEFKSLGQASSELIARLTNKAKVGAKSGGQAQPPSKITPHMGGENVIYLNSKQDFRQKKPNKNTPEKSNSDCQSCNVVFLFV